MSITETSNGPVFNLVHRLSVDSKRRIQVPKKWRPQNEDELLSLFIWKPPGQQEICLLALPPEPYHELVNKIKAMPFSDPKAESLRRWLGKNSAQVSQDKSGRICLPEMMATAAGLKTGSEAVAVGLLDRWQIWSPERWIPRSDLDDEMQAEAMKLI